jgi:hypothetical protein
VSWDNKPFIFDEDGLPATNSAVSNARFQEQMEEEQAQDELPRTCPWCGLLCESVEALAEHEEGCDE